MATITIILQPMAHIITLLIIEIQLDLEFKTIRNLTLEAAPKVTNT